MKFMITWCIHDDKRHEALEIFSGMSEEEAAGEFGNLNVIGRWHDVIGFTGVAIAETDNPEDLNSWLIKWNSMCDIEAVPVLDDAETRDFGRKTKAAAG